jgi:UDP-N-acetyl-D-glucosamine dehydrogenase
MTVSNMARSEIKIKRKNIEDLPDLIESREVGIGIFGAGYVGLPLACAFADAGFETIACDSDLRKVNAIRNGEVYVEDHYAKDALPRLAKSKALRAESEVRHVASLVDFAIIAVPTPLANSREPDLSYVTAVTADIAKENQSGRFIILESSVYPGATEEVVKPILEQNGLRAGVDFGLAYSPERIDYGNSTYDFRIIPKVVGGITPLCTKVASELYSCVIKAQVVPVSSTRAAEATKMLENTYRFVNIALINELAILYERLGIDVYEVVSAASTKPFGFQPFYPGPGVGGHCIPKDPHYLSYKARQLGLSLKLVEVSQEIDQRMIDHIVTRLENHLAKSGRTLGEAKVVILGLAFKANVSDVRNSPSIKLANRLENYGTRISTYDPLVKQISIGTRVLVSSKNIEDAVKGASILFLMTPHTAFKSVNLTKLHALTDANAVIMDARGFWTDGECTSAGFDYLCLGRPSEDEETETKHVLEN